MEENRDLLRDLELCEKATPGPWKLMFGMLQQLSTMIQIPIGIRVYRVQGVNVLYVHEELVREYKDELGRTMHLHKTYINDNWRSIYNTDGVQIVGAYDYEDNGMCTTREDAEFITSSRTGWPHAIERALKAEAEVEKLRAEVERLKVREEVLYDFATKYLCPYEGECPEPDYDTSDRVDCWEKFLAREEAREREKDGGRDSN